MTPIPVTLDGAAHTITLPREAVAAADVAPGSTYSLQITDGSNVYLRGAQCRPGHAVAHRPQHPDVVSGAASALTGITPSGGPSRSTSSGVAGGRPAPGSFRCTAPAGRIAGRSLGPVRLGMTRTQARRPFRRVDTRGRRTMDFFCPTHGGIRVGYASPALAAALPRSDRARTRGRVVLILTASSAQGSATGACRRSASPAHASRSTGG